MSYNGSGTFLINSAGQPVVANTVISATVFNALTSDLATGLSTAITKDGQTTITNNIPFGSNKITGLGSGTAAADAANLGQVQSTVAKLITVTGTDTITGSMSPQLTAYAAGQLFYFVANAANTSAVTLNIDSLGAKSITRDGSSALAAGDINSGEVVVVIYDGTRFQMINAANSFGNTTINGTLTVTGNAGFQANVSITSALSVGGVFAVTGAATFTANPTLSGGTANGVLYLNGSKVATSGSALTFDGTKLSVIDSTRASAVIADSAGRTLRLQGPDASANPATVGTSTNHDLLLEAGSSAGGLNVMRFATGGSEQMRLTSTGLGIGTTSPGAKLDVQSATATFRLQSTTGTNAAYLWATNTGGDFYFGRDNSTGATFGTNSAYSAVLYSANAYPMVFFTNATERLRLDSAGNLGLGVTPSAWGSPFGSVLQIGPLGNSIASRTDGNQSLYMGVNWFYDGSNLKYINTNWASYYRQFAGAHEWHTAPSGTAGSTITFTQAMTLDASGNLALGGTTNKITGLAGGGNGLTIQGATAPTLALYDTTNAGYYLNLGQIEADSYLWNIANGFLSFGTNNGEKARITAGGDLQFATTNASPVTNNVAGIVLQSAGVGQFSSDGNPGIQVNRKTNDGDLVVFRQDGTQEGSISVSGNTVSYNAFAGSHWSQLQDGSKPDILRGTVMESINELCVWPDEQNERLPKSKISDTVGSKKVYGVFMAWDNGWTATNDMYVTAVGAFICRVNGSVTVQEGDLLESNGDGTARVQADDIIRSSTIGKVTSTVKTHQYDDGSYCVPTVLYCG